jgi:hypothetical protein
MASDPITAEKCRERAQICRDMARAQFNPQTRKQFEDLAAAWEQICEELDRIEERKSE